MIDKLEITEGLPDFILREAIELDMSFIRQSFTTSQREFGDNGQIDNKAYFDWQYNRIRSILARPNLYIIIACNPNDSNHIFGYIIAEYLDDIPVIHYVYVKLAFRNSGIAKSLFKLINKDLGSVPMIMTNIDPTRSILVNDKETGKPIIKHVSFFINTKRRFSLIYKPMLIMKEF